MPREPENMSPSDTEEGQTLGEPLCSEDSTWISPISWLVPGCKLEYLLWNPTIRRHRAEVAVFTCRGEAVPMRWSDGSNGETMSLELPPRSTVALFGDPTVQFQTKLGWTRVCSTAVDLGGYSVVRFASSDVDWQGVIELVSVSKQVKVIPVVALDDCDFRYALVNTLLREPAARLFEIRCVMGGDEFDTVEQVELGPGQSHGFVVPHGAAASTLGIAEVKALDGKSAFGIAGMYALGPNRGLLNGIF